jgi:hypothetical protein
LPDVSASEGQNGCLPDTSGACIVRAPRGVVGFQIRSVRPKKRWREVPAVGVNRPRITTGQTVWFVGVVDLLQVPAWLPNSVIDAGNDAPFLRSPRQFSCAAQKEYSSFDFSDLERISHIR